MRKTILFIHHGATTGGSAICLFEGLKRIDRANNRVIVILPEEGPFSDMLAKEGIEYKVMPMFNFYYCSQAKSFSCGNPEVFFNSLLNAFVMFFKGLGNIACLPLIILRYNPGVVVINPATPLLSGLIAKLMGRRVVWHIREVISTEKSKALKKIISSIIDFSAKEIVVMSEFSFSDIAALNVKKPHIIYDGAVDLDTFHPRSLGEEEFKRFGLKRNDKVVGFVGQIYENKGYLNLIEAAMLVILKNPDTKFLIIGNSYAISRENGKPPVAPRGMEDETKFRKIVSKMKISDNFIFLGQRFDVPDIMPLMNCLVFPSIVPEVFGRVMVEAMACGLPVIATNIGAAPSIVKQGLTGLLVEPHKPCALSSALVDILTDEKKAKLMGEAGRKRAEELFNIKNVVPQLLEVYEAS